MKKFFTACFLFFFAFLLFAQERTFYFVRHGQRGDLRYQKTFKECKEDCLMPKGVLQAQAVGEYLKKLGFEGTVFVSPYYRTLETASLACERMGIKKMILEPRVQEVTGLKSLSKPVGITKKCLSKKEIKQNFPQVVIPKKVKFPWRLENEKSDFADERISLLIEDFLKNTEGDLLVVCHGGIMNSIVREMNKRGAAFPRQKNYNCCLYSFTFDEKTQKIIRFADETPNFMPNELYTDNLAIVFR